MSMMPPVGRILSINHHNIAKYLLPDKNTNFCFNYYLRFYFFDSGNNLHFSDSSVTVLFKIPPLALVSRWRKNMTVFSHVIIVQNLVLRWPRSPVTLCQKMYEFHESISHLLIIIEITLYSIMSLFQTKLHIM